MPAGDYIEGVLLFGFMLAACAGGAALVGRRRFAAFTVAEKILAYALVTTLGVLAVHLVPAIVGLLARGSVIVASLAWLGGCFAVSRRAQPPNNRSILRMPAGEAEDMRLM